MAAEDAKRPGGGLERSAALGLLSPEGVLTALRQQQYLLAPEAATVVYLALVLGKPLLVEGPAGVGKTALAKALAEALKQELVRLQCYEGLDESRALYEWNYQKQLLYLQVAKDASWERVGSEIYQPSFLLPRPLLLALTAQEGVILLIDEVDKADEAFESLLLETLAEFQITIPELGTITARSEPVVVLTSNNQRGLSDALRRRCLHLYLDYPDPALEARILSLKLPQAPEQLTRQATAFVAAVRRRPLLKPPSIAETIDWVRALVLTRCTDLSPANVAATLGCLLKVHSDQQEVAACLPALLKKGVAS